jgi:hypothetical protein
MSGKLFFRLPGEGIWKFGGAVSNITLHWPVCPYCTEEITPYWPVRSFLTDGKPIDYHEECAIRMLVGSAAHQLQECSCFVKGGSRHDPPGVSKRAAAKLAFDCFTLFKSRP